jgi:Lon protease-like protein
MSAAMNIIELPLFPLDLVLFPDGLLPLRIFEVRYLDMVKRCHKSSTPFGVVGLTEGVEVQQTGQRSERFHSVGTLARIVELSSPQPGLLLIRCQGESRFSVQRSEKLRHGLWVANAEMLPGDAEVTVPADLRHVANRLKTLLEQWQARGLPSEPLPLPHAFDDCGWVANRWCELLPLPVSLKQQLMSLDNPLLRLELVGDLLERKGWS